MAAMPKPSRANFLDDTLAAAFRALRRSHEIHGESLQSACSAHADAGKDGGKGTARARQGHEIGTGWARRPGNQRARAGLGRAAAGGAKVAWDGLG